jgi:hypothetical protein
MPYVNPRGTNTFADIANVYGLQATESLAATLLSGLDLKETIILCGRLNVLVSGVGKVSLASRTRAAMDIIALRDEERRILGVLDPIGGYERHFVFFRGQLLELMRLAVKYCSKSPVPKCFVKTKNRRNFLKAALTASSLWSVRVGSDRIDLSSMTENTVKDYLAYLRKVAEDTTPAPDGFNAIGRGWLLFSKYLPKYYPAFEAEFLASTKMTFEQYFTCVTGLMTYVSLGTDVQARPLNVNTVGGATSYRDVFPDYLGLDTQTPEQFAKASNGSRAKFEKALWQRPIIVFPDGVSIVADPICFSAKLSIGPLFFLLRGHPERQETLFSAFGYAFEEYVNSILGRMFHNTHFNLKKWVGKDTDFEVDALAREDAAALVFESKAKFLREEMISGNDYANFLEHLRESYVDPRNAVWQLANITSAISSRTWRELPEEFEDSRVIFPIVVTHDIRMDSPGTRLFFDREMKRLLDRRTSSSLIRPLVVLTIKDLEQLEGSISSKEFSFVDFLQDYIEEVSKDPLCSLHNFIAYTKYNNFLRPGATVARTSFKVLDRAQSVLFSKSTPVEGGSDNNVNYCEVRLAADVQMAPDTTNPLVLTGRFRPNFEIGGRLCLCEIMETNPREGIPIGEKGSFEATVLCRSSDADGLAAGVQFDLRDGPLRVFARCTVREIYSSFENPDVKL